ncbi:MAG: hypothetical protein ABH954_05185 [Candidatus Omnitrophota bacterium]
MKDLKKKIIFNLIFVLVIIACCLLLAEIGTRIYLVVSGKGGYILLPDDYLGRVHAPNSRFNYQEDFSKEFSIKRKTNALGLIGEEISVRKPENVFRILVLGDSFTEALQVEEGKNFCEQLQQLLNQDSTSSEKKYQVLNAGISGYSPISEYLYLKRELIKLNPDLVILQLFANDIFEDHKVGAMSVIGEDGLPMKINRFFMSRYLEGSPPSYKDSKFKNLSYKFKKFLLKRSKFFQVIVRAGIKYYKKSEIHKQMTALPEFNDANQFFIIQDDNTLLDDKNFRIRTWQKSRKYILAIKQLAEANNADFLIVLIPPEAQLKLSYYGLNSRMYFSRKPNFHFNKLLNAFSRKENANYLDLLNAFERNKAKGLYFDRDGHLTEVGHKVVSQAIFDFFVYNGLVR